MAETINMPKLGFDMAEGTLVRWLKKEGEPVSKGEVLAEIETDKATVEVESSAEGIVRKLLVDEGAVVPVNTPIAVVGTADEKIEAAVPAPVKTGQVEVPMVEKQAIPVEEGSWIEPAGPSSPSKASPLARKVASDLGVDLAKVKGSGPGGRIVRRDVESALQSVPPIARAADIAPVLPQIPSAADELLPLSKLRQAIARRMAESKTTVPHFYVTHEYRLDLLVEVRRQLNESLPEGEKVSINDFIVKAAALTLRQFPNLNATFQSEKLLRHGQVNVGVAVAVENGLLTVVCRGADAKPLRQIASEMKRMAAGAREGKVRPEDIEGSTFSISNLGMYDVENFLAIINPPEAAILAVGSAREVPVVEGGMVKPGWRMKATLSVDHRVSDGVEAAKFLQALEMYLEEPVRLLV